MNAIRKSFTNNSDTTVNSASIVPVSLKTSANSRIFCFAEQVRDFGLGCFQIDINDLVNKYLGAGNSNNPFLTDQELLLLVNAVLDGHGSNS